MSIDVLVKQFDKRCEAMHDLLEVAFEQVTEGVRQVQADCAAALKSKQEIQSDIAKAMDAFKSTKEIAFASHDDEKAFLNKLMSSYGNYGIEQFVCERDEETTANDFDILNAQYIFEVSGDYTKEQIASFNQRLLRLAASLSPLTQERAYFYQDEISHKQLALEYEAYEEFKLMLDLLKQLKDLEALPHHEMVILLSYYQILAFNIHRLNFDYQAMPAHLGMAVEINAFIETWIYLKKLLELTSFLTGRLIETYEVIVLDECLLQTA